MPRCYMVKKGQRQSPSSPTEGSVAPTCYSPDEDSAITVSQDQIKGMLDFMEENKDFASKKLADANASVLDVVMWHELCDHLNLLGGCVLSTQQWQAVWVNFMKRGAEVEEKLEREESVEVGYVEQRIITIFWGHVFGRQELEESDEASDTPEDVEANSAAPTVATPATSPCPCRLLQSSVIICPLSQQQPPVSADALEAPEQPPEQQPEQQNQSTSRDARRRRLVRLPILSDQQFKRKMINILKQMQKDNRKTYRRILSLV